MAPTMHRWRIALLLVAVIALPAALARDVPVFAGGTKSVGQRGYHDMAMKEYTGEMRALGVRLYIHPLGWEHTTDADKELLHQYYPEPPIYENSVGSDLTKSPRQYYKRLAPYWPKAYAVTLDNMAQRPAAAMQFQKDQFKEYSDCLAPVQSPNTPNKHPEHKNPHWKDAYWDNFRANAKIGGGLATDAPPDFYFKREEEYRAWVADAVKWATSNGLKAIVIIYARNSDDFAGLTRRYVDDLEKRGAHPSAWAFDGYYAAEHDAKHPMGDEHDPNSQDYSVRWLAGHEQGKDER